MEGFLDRIYEAAARAEKSRAAYAPTRSRRVSWSPCPSHRLPSENEDEWLRRRSGGPRDQLEGVPSYRFRSASTVGLAPVFRGGASAPIVSKAGLASGAQPALFKIISGASGARRTGALLTYLGTREDERTGQKHDIPIVTERGEVLRNARDRADLLSDWQSRFSAHAKAKDVGRFVIEHTGPKLAPSLVGAILLDAFEGRRLVFAMDGSGHGSSALHVVVALSARGHKLALSPQALGRVQASIAARLAEERSEVSRFELESSGHALEGVRYQLAFLADGNLGVAFDAFGRRFEPQNVNLAAKAWAQEINSYRARDVTHALFSARQGTDPQAFFVAVQAVMDAQFAGHRWVAAQHHDKGHVHVHVVVVHKRDDGERLKTSKADLERYRMAIATAAREQGIAMVATRRTDVAATRPFNAAHAGLVERREASDAIQQRVGAKRARVFELERHPTRQRVYTQAVEEWAEARRVLTAVGQLEAASVAEAIAETFSKHGIVSREHTSRPVSTRDAATSAVGFESWKENQMPVQTVEQFATAVKDIRDGFAALRSTAAETEKERIDKLERTALALSVAQYEAQAETSRQATARTDAQIADRTDTGSSEAEKVRLRTDERLEQVSERALKASATVEAEVSYSGAGPVDPYVRAILERSREDQQRALQDIETAVRERGEERAELDRRLVREAPEPETMRSPRSPVAVDAAFVEPRQPSAIDAGSHAAPRATTLPAPSDEDSNGRPAKTGVEGERSQEGTARVKGTAESVPVTPAEFHASLKEDQPELAKRLTWREDVKAKSVSYRLDGKEVFRDSDDRVTLADERPRGATEAGLRLAIRRFGEEISVEGTDEFKREIVEVAASSGLAVKFKQPELAALFEKLTADREANGGLANSLSGAGISPDVMRSSEISDKRSQTNAEAAAEADVGIKSSRVQNEAVQEPRAPQPRDDNETSQAPTPNEPGPPATSRRSIHGELLNHSAAPYQFEKEGKESYYAVVANETGEKKTVWGVDLARAIQQAGAQIGDAVELKNVGRMPVTVKEPIKDQDGKVIGTREVSTTRNEWEVQIREKRLDREQPSRDEVGIDPSAATNEKVQAPQSGKEKKNDREPEV